MKKLIVVALSTVLLALSAQAQLIMGVSGGDPLSVGPGMAGFEFQVGSQPLTIMTLGVFDEFNDGVLNSSHTVGIWDANTQTLLGKTVVAPQTAVEVGSFFFANLLAPVTLQAGHTYRIGAQYADIDLDLARGNIPAGGVTANSDITLKDAYLSSGSGFGFPDLNVSGANLGFIGPNAGFTAVPEPATWGAITAGALALWAALRRKKARQKAGAGAAA